MSVRKGDREEGDLKVIDASKDLLAYTYDRVMDRNIFSKADRWPLAKTMLDCAIQARSCICRANDIRVETIEEAKDRLELEKLAIGYLGTLETMIDLCNIKGKISDERTQFWIGLVVATLKPLKGLLKTDRKRYKSLLK
jgi:hypothetical protein